MTVGLKMLVALVLHPTSTDGVGALTHSHDCSSRACIPLSRNGFVVTDCRLAQTRERVLVRVVNALSQGRRAHS